MLLFIGFIKKDLIISPASKQVGVLQYPCLPKVCAVSFSDLMIWRWYFPSQLCGYISEMHEGRVYFSELMVQSWLGRQWKETNGHKPHRSGDVIGQVVKLKRRILDSQLYFLLLQICASIAEGCTSSFQGCNSYLRTFRLFSSLKNRAIL